MSRVLKFRGWCPKCNRFEPIPLWEKDILSEEDDFSEWMNGLIVEQYTGLKDKNGKEIYEGDIVREDIEVGDDDIDGEYRYQVVWDEETLCWSLSPNYGTIHKDIWETNLSREVIGNIHEPPKDFRPEHLKRMGVSISKGSEE